MKKTAYIIGISQPAQGLLTLYKHIASHIIYAEEMGYIPIVDCKHYINQYFKDGATFKENSWEYFFEQPAGYSLNDISEFDEIIFSDNVEWADKKYSILPTIMKNDVTNNRELHKYSENYAKYLKFNPEIEAFLKTKYLEKTKGDDILGVLCRGTDYINMKPHGHSVQPPTDEVIAKAKELLQKYPNIKKIYLATEDANIYKKFSDTFKDKLIENEQYVYTETEQKALADIKVDRKDHFYNLGKEYLLSLYILSKSKYFIAGRNNGSLGVYLMSDLFKNQEVAYVWDLGLYGEIKYSNFMEKVFSIKKEYSVSKSLNRDYSQKKCNYCITILGLKLKFSKIVKNPSEQDFTALIFNFFVVLLDFNVVIFFNLIKRCLKIFFVIFLHLFFCL